MESAELFKQAVLAGNLDQVRRLLEKGQSPEVVIGTKRTRRRPNEDLSPDGFRGLHVAAYEDDSELFTLLLDFGADLDARTRFGKTALELAVEWDSARVVAAAISAGVVLDRPSQSLGLLVPAAGGSNFEMVRRLLSGGSRKGLDDAAANSCGRKADPRIIKALIEHGGKIPAPDPREWSPRVHAMRSEHAPALLTLLRDHSKATTFVDACIDGDLALVSSMLKNGADPEAELRYQVRALQCATHAGQLPIVTLLIDAGVDLDHSHGLGRPIATALIRGRLNIAEELHKSGASLADIHHEVVHRGLSTEAIGWICEKLPPRRDAQRILAMSLRGDLAWATIALEHGADANGNEAWGRLPLMIAARCGNAEMVQLLLDHGADAKARDRNGRSILHYVLTYDDVTDLWDQEEFDPSQYDREWAKTPGRAVQLLLAAGAKWPWDEEPIDADSASPTS